MGADRAVRQVQPFADLAVRHAVGGHLGDLQFLRGEQVVRLDGMALAGCAGGAKLLAGQVAPGCGAEAVEGVAGGAQRALAGAAGWTAVAKDPSASRRLVVRYVLRLADPSGEHRNSMPGASHRPAIRVEFEVRRDGDNGVWMPEPQIRSSYHACCWLAVMSGESGDRGRLESVAAEPGHRGSRAHASSSAGSGSGPV